MVTKTTAWGVISFWSLSESCDRRVLNEGWSALGLNKYVPDAPNDFAVLKRALEQVYPKAGTIPRQLRTKTGFFLLDETRGVDANQYGGTTTVKLRPGTNGLDFANTDGSEFVYDDRAMEVVSRFREGQGRLSAAQLAKAMTAVLTQEYHAVALRPSGGIYWMSGHHNDNWRAAAEVVERACPGSSVYFVENGADTDSVRAVRDAVIHSVEVQSRQMVKEMEEGDLGERALRTKMTEISRLADQVVEYEAILAESLEPLRARLEELRQAHGTAQLLASVGGTASTQKEYSYA
jgi:hypothetical protein